MLNWGEMRRTARLREEMRSTEKKRRDRGNAELLAFSRGAALCQSCAHVQGYGPECAR
jgi:hypothetical protein